MQEKRYYPFTALLAILVIIAMLSTPVSSIAQDRPAPESIKRAKWTFMIFLNGVNDLYPYGPRTISQLKKAVPNDDFNIVILRGYLSKPGEKVIISKGKAEIVEKGLKLDMGDYKELVRFAKWTHENYPADHYLIDIWNHGMGWKKKGRVSTKGISYDDNTGNHITTLQLGESMRMIKSVFGHNVDILGMDACLMQMAEVAYELKDCVDYIVAAEEIEPGTGWPYDKFADIPGKNPSVTPKQYAMAMVEAHKESYIPVKDEATTCSAVECSKLPAFYAKLEELALALKSKIGQNDIFEAAKRAADEAQKFDEGDHADLAHFCQLLTQYAKDDDIKIRAEHLIRLMVSSPSKLIVANGTTGDAMKNAFGLAVYLPRGAFDPEYRTLINFGKTAWADFIEAYAARNGAQSPSRSWPSAEQRLPAASENK